MSLTLGDDLEKKNSEYERAKFSPRWGVEPRSPRNSSPRKGDVGALFPLKIRNL